MNKKEFQAKMEKEFHNGMFVEIHTGDYETILGWFKDNPVPSIDNTYLRQLKKDVSSIVVTDDDDLLTIEAVVILIEKLQNGVETNNEQPKCKYIKREGESCTKNNNCTYPNCEEDDYLG